MGQQPDADQWGPHHRGGRPGWGDDLRHGSLRAPSPVARIGARVIDAVVVAVPVVVALTAARRALGVSGAAEDEPQPAALDFETWFGFDLEAWTGMAVLAVLMFAYFVVAESRWGATAGKRLLRLRVAAAGGRAPSPLAAAKRNVWVLAGLIPAAGALLVLAVAAWTIQDVSASSADRGWHDRFAGTIVRR